MIFNNCKHNYYGFVSLVVDSRLCIMWVDELLASICSETLSCSASCLARDRLHNNIRIELCQRCCSSLPYRSSSC